MTTPPPALNLDELERRAKAAYGTVSCPARRRWNVLITPSVALALIALARKAERYAQALRDARSLAVVRAKKIGEKEGTLIDIAATCDEAFAEMPK